LKLLLDEMYPNVRDYRQLVEALLAAGESHSGLVSITDKRWSRSDPGALIAALDRMITSTPRQPLDMEIWL
jgi:hypothetical protein